MHELIIRGVLKSDLEACAAIESSCFDPAEAAPIESIERRIDIYPDGFLIAEMDGKVIGMINSGSTHKDDITDEAFKKLIGHRADGENMVVFSLAVSPGFQGLGVSRKLMEKFIEVSKRLEKKKILLLCKDYHVNYYERLGFGYGGLSESRHGGFGWHEMVMEFTLDN